MHLYHPRGSAPGPAGPERPAAGRRLRPRRAEGVLDAPANLCVPRPPADRARLGPPRFTIPPVPELDGLFNHLYDGGHMRRTCQEAFDSPGILAAGFDLTNIEIRHALHRQPVETTTAHADNSCQCLSTAESGWQSKRSRDRAALFAICAETAAPMQLRRTKPNLNATRTYSHAVDRARAGSLALAATSATFPRKRLVRDFTSAPRLSTWSDCPMKSR